MASCNMLRLFNFGVIYYEIKNGRNILVWLATWGGSLPGQLRYIFFCDRMALSKVISSRYLAVLLLIPKIAFNLNLLRTDNLVTYNDIASRSLGTYNSITFSTF